MSDLHSALEAAIRYEGCCRAAVDSDGQVHDHSEWYGQVVKLEAVLAEAKAAAARMREARNAAQAQCRALGPLVEAVLRFAEVETGRTPTMENCSAWLTELAVRREALLAAVDQLGQVATVDELPLASGGPVTPGQIYLVGEAGPMELPEEWRT